MDFAGVVAGVGEGGDRFSVGGGVFGTTDAAGGAFAEYLVAPVGPVCIKPSCVDFNSAAAVPTSACTALQAPRRQGSPTGKGDRVLVNGASGGVGTFAVQIAKAFGAHVTGVCSTQKLGLVKGLGADEVVDYTQEDIVRTSSIRGNLKYDRIVDCVGNRSMGAWKGLLKPRGDFVAVSLGGTCARTHNTH